MDIITLIRQKSEGGTPAERQLAGAILQNVEEASRTTIANLAANAGVSEPTVTRFALSLGLEGTRDLKLQLAQAVAIGGSYLDAKGDAISLGEGKAVATICGHATKAINDLREVLSEELVVEISQLLASATQVQLFGTGGISSLAAQELNFRLFRLGLNVVNQVDGRLQRMTAALAKPGTVVMGFSLSGGAASVVDSLSIARQYGAITIAVAPADTPLARIAEYVIPYRYVEDGHVYKPNSARFALLALVDSLAFKAAEIIGPAVLENLRRIKQTLTISDNYDSTLPLGD
ncbi:MAG: MurR/RpiR family transcriptional regulator [Mesorhizobium sp.]